LKSERKLLLFWYEFACLLQTQLLPLAHSNLSDVNNTQHSCTSKSSLQATNQYNQCTFRSGIIIYKHCGTEWLACEPVLPAA